MYEHIQTILLIIAIIIFVLVLAFIFRIVIRAISQDSKRIKKTLSEIPKEEYTKIKTLYNKNIIFKELKKICQLMKIGALLIAIGIGILSVSDNNIIAGVMISIFMYALFSRITILPKAKYYDVYKKNIITTLIKNININNEYYPSAGLKRYVYDEIITERYDRFSSEDLIIGPVDNNYFFEMSDVQTLKRERDSDNKTYYMPVFSGTVAQVKMNKSIHAQLLITKGASNDLPKVLIDNEIFSKYYTVYSTNEILALRILTHDIMEMIMELEKKLGTGLEIIIKNDLLVFRFYTSGMLEPYMMDEQKEIVNIYLFDQLIRTMKEIMSKTIKLIEEIDI